MRPYGIPSCITHRPLPVYQISFKSKKLFVDGRTDIFPPLILLGRLLEVDLKIIVHLVFETPYFLESMLHTTGYKRVHPGADPELVSRGSPCRAALRSPPSIPPLLSPSPVRSRPSPPIPILPLRPSLPFPLLPSPSLPLKRGGGSGGPHPENFEILDCFR